VFYVRRSETRRDFHRESPVQSPTCRLSWNRNRSLKERIIVDRLSMSDLPEIAAMIIANQEQAGGP
jgi:hypothetical protein